MVQHGWLARGEHEVPCEVGDVEAWLTPPEAERLAQLRFTKRRTEFLLRRWTAKHAVAVALGVADAHASGDGASVAALARIAVLNRMSGAPYVLVDGEPAGVDVSVTDRAGWAVCLVGAGLDAVGVDLELVEARSDGFVADFLTASEADEVRAAGDPDTRAALANLMWSAKESALKVLRTGLRADTRTVEVTLDRRGAASSGWRPLSVRHVPSGRDFPGWWRRDGEFVLTTASVAVTVPPVVLPSSGDLAGAAPVHSWLAEPVVPAAVRGDRHDAVRPRGSG